MYYAVILNAILMLILYLIFKAWLKIELVFGIAGMILIIMPHTIGIVRGLDSETCIATLVSATLGTIMLVADVAKQMKPTR